MGNAGLAQELAKAQPQGLSAAVRRTIDAAELRLEALLALTLRRADAEWCALTARPLMSGLTAMATPQTRLIAMPRDFRPADPGAAQALLGGVLRFGGEALPLAPDGDPFDGPSPSAEFAEALHGFDFLRDLIGAGEAGAREGLRLFLLWRRGFSTPSPFVWDTGVLARRTYNLLCASGPMLQVASEWEGRRLAEVIARSARRLLRTRRRSADYLQALIAAAIAGCALSSPVGRGLKRRAVARLNEALALWIDETGMAPSRCPEEALERLFDLLTLDDTLAQSGHGGSPQTVRAIEALAGAVRFLRLDDRALAAFNGGEAVGKARVSAALALVESLDGPAVSNRTPVPASLAGSSQAPPAPASLGGYERLRGGGVEILIDAAPPPVGPASVRACAQPLALAVVCRGDRLITNAGWSPRAGRRQALRLSAGGSTVEVEHHSAGAPMGGWIGEALGARLTGAAERVAVERFAADGGELLATAHDGWLKTLGVVHERRLFLVHENGELRAEDRLVRIRGDRPLMFSAHFHLAPEVRASLARDGRSCILRGRNERGWRFLTDAGAIDISPDVAMEGGQARRTQRIVLYGALPPNARASVIRWQLTAVEPPPQPPRRLRVETLSIEGGEPGFSDVISPHEALETLSQDEISDSRPQPESGEPRETGQGEPDQA
jgi:uncharacterized heparinase superfamily protein